MILRNDIRYFEKWDINDVRRLIYFSQDNEWVKAGDDLLRVSINNVIKSKEYPIEGGGGVRFGQEIIPVSKEAEDQWKLLLARHAKSIGVSGVGNTHGRKYKTLAGINLEVAHSHFHHIYFCLGDKGVSLDITIENFASYQSGTMRKGKPPQVSEDSSIIEDAIKHELWLAAISGDVEQLNDFLVNHPEFDLYSSYKGYNGHCLIQAMFECTPELRLPLNAQKSDFKATLEALVKHGFDFNKPVPSLGGQSSADLCEKYANTQQNLWFFQKSPLHLLLIREINQLIGREDSLNTQVSNKNCTII